MKSSVRRVGGCEKIISRNVFGRSEECRTERLVVSQKP